MKRYYPKSQQLQMAAVLIWGLLFLAIRQRIGLDWESGGPALVFLSGLAAAGYLTSGKRVDVDLLSGGVRSVWRFAGMTLWQRRPDIVVERLELRPEWMLRNEALNRSLVYDLVLAGAGDVAVDLKEDQVSFRLAERRARAVGAELGLPVAVRWDRRFEDVPCEVRERGEWGEPFAYPDEMRDWRRWV